MEGVRPEEERVDDEAVPSSAGFFLWRWSMAFFSLDNEESDEPWKTYNVGGKDEAQLHDRHHVSLSKAT
ncbi:hypothetical protein RvY_12551 [Ramazzottius varieornatus]|uniref:Uncharacterized protein n=1 Tax=Ramazzottius varieornatus TaxID=947166 RepID=A0A1D1VM61_RAMVA|nr:hypothetical protein RvY_12551 [Ramazzottius varieornatus]